ncbi:MAG: hypothetical protein NTZ17_05130 [Phycisphaerae bacterium]|nr:hypothetical protein [Phycisphaerae bacterium]
MRRPKEVNLCAVWILSLLFFHISLGPARADLSMTQEEGLIRNPKNNHYYKLTEGLSWTQAEEQAIRSGGHLVTINDREEELWLRIQSEPPAEPVV